MGVQLGTAKSWVRRGLAQMNRCLTGTEPDGRELVAAEYAAGGLRAWCAAASIAAASATPVTAARSMYGKTGSRC